MDKKIKKESLDNKAVSLFSVYEEMVVNFDFESNKFNENQGDNQLYLKEM
jgi:hypothetical protein